MKRSTLYVLAVALTVAVALVLVRAAVPVGTGLSSPVMTNFNARDFTVTLAAGTVPTNVIMMNIPMAFRGNSFDATIVNVMMAAFNPTTGYVPYKAGPTNFLDSWWRYSANGMETDTNIFFGPGVTNKFYRDGRALVYTNVSYGSAWRFFPTNQGAFIAPRLELARSDNTAAGITCDNAGNLMTYGDTSAFYIDQLTTFAGDVLPKASDSYGLGDEHSASGTWLKVFTKTNNVVGYDEGTSNTNYVWTSQSMSGTKAVFNLQSITNGVNGPITGFEFRTNDVPIATIGTGGTSGFNDLYVTNQLSVGPTAETYIHPDSPDGVANFVFTTTADHTTGNIFEIWEHTDRVLAIDWAWMLYVPDITLTGDAYVQGTVRSGNLVVTNNVTIPPTSLTPADPQTITFTGPSELWLVMTGNVNLASSGLAAGQQVNLRCDNTTATNCYVVLPAGWRKLSGTVSNVIGSGAIGLLSLKSYAANDTNVIAVWASE